jgi:hypothetical protein
LCCLRVDDCRGCRGRAELLAGQVCGPLFHDNLAIYFVRQPCLYLGCGGGALARYEACHAGTVVAAAPPSVAAATSLRQQEVWASVRNMQDRFSAVATTDVRAAASQSSLQLALENKKLAAMRAPMSRR